MDDDFDVLKLVMIGDSNVGKTCITLKYSENKFNEAHLSTIGVDYVSKDLEIGNKKLKIQIWDTAGQDRFRNITKSYLRNGDGVLLVFDVTKKDSFNNCDPWVSSLKEMTSDVPFIILGNKCDATPREVSTEEGKLLGEKYKTQYFDTSAKTGTNIDEAFRCIAQRAYENITKIREREKENVKLGRTMGKKQCCK